MNSIARHLDEYDFAQEVRHERKVHKGSVLLVEGDTDIKRFGSFIDQKECSFVNCYGKKHVIGAVNLLYDDGFPGVLGLVDADFDRVENCLDTHEGIIHSESHDFDLDWMRAEVIEKYFAEAADSEKCELHGSVDVIIDKILDGLKVISVARLLNQRRVINYRLSEIDFSPCFCNFMVDPNGYVDLIFAGRPATTEIRAALKDQLIRASAQPYDLRQLTNGHDFYRALGVCLRSELGSRRVPQTWASEIEMHIRLARISHRPAADVGFSEAAGVLSRFGGRALVF